jgi:hypothetical protein
MDPAGRSPAEIGGPHLDVEPFAESKAEAIGKRQTLAFAPSAGRPFGVVVALSVRLG